MPLIEIPVGDTTAEAWLSRPEDGEHPGVLLFVDAFGVRPQIAAMADRIASWGYVVMAPNVFYRDGTVAELAPTVDLHTPEGRDAGFAAVKPRVQGLTSDLLEADLPAYVAGLRAQPGVAPGPIGVTGYCMGGRIATRAACLLPDDVAACGGFHAGGLVTDEPDSPHLALPRARASFVYGHADNDRSLPPEAVEAFAKALSDAGLDHVAEVYPGAPHGYTMADTWAYDEDAAERHYVALRTLLDRTLR